MFCAQIQKNQNQIYQSNDYLNSYKKNESFEISGNFLYEKLKLIDDDSELSLFLNKNGIKSNEVNDIILKYKNTDNKNMVYKEITNYLNIKKEIDTFPIELQEKILEYARDTAHIGVDPNKIKQQIKNELVSIQNATIDINKTIKTMKQIEKNKNKNNNNNNNNKNEKEINYKLESTISEFIDCVDNNLQKQSDTILKRKTNNLSSKILAIMDSRRSAEIGVRTLIDYLYRDFDDNDNDNNDNDNKMQIPYNIICNAIGKEIERDLFSQNKLSSSEIMKFIQENEKNMDYLEIRNNNKLSMASHLGIKIGDSFNLRNLYEIGGIIIDTILNSCFYGLNKEIVFKHDIIYNHNSKKQIGIIFVSNKLFIDLLLKELRYKAPKEIHPIAKPMIIPPRPWKNIDDGPFFYYNEKLMRFIDYKNQYKPLRNNKDIEYLLKCINILQSSSWKINEKVLNVMNHLYENENGNIAGLPKKYDIEIPEKSDFIDDKQYQYKLKCIKKLNAEQHSLRCDLNLKLNLAKELIKENEIYFPLNIDFRGRIYPISPHINHIGSDIVRGMMLFSKKKKLGKRGWYWLNVNLANKFGFDKVKNDERFEWSLNHKNDIINVWKDPLKNRWWLSADYPFQALSICIEIGEAYTYDDIYKYECNLPIGQDGSCNGLQHYAAMLRDEEMAKHVNVANNDIYNLGRGDVYRAVQKCVINMIEKDYKNKHELALLINGKLTRKIVKQTVMTSVYGVTSYGAKNQVKKWLLHAIDNNEFNLGDDIDIYSENGKNILNKLSNYISKYTLYGIGLTNTPGYLSMLWLKNCGYLIAKNGFRVSWITPILNLPCTQHYNNNEKQIKCKNQSIMIKSYDKDKINILKQSSAFPPNFVHSLDSTHCLLTAYECYTKYGLQFASIHDSFWSHPCDIDIMSKVLRDKFILLHSKSLLNELYKSLCILYPEIDFPPPPKQSNFDLDQVRNSEYFFS